MSIIALLAAVKALFLGASWLKWCEMRKQKVLMGNNRNLGRSTPLLDEHLKRKTGGATRLQIFASSKLAEICRQVVRTRAFEYMLLRMIQSGMRNHQSKSFITRPEVVL